MTSLVRRRAALQAAAAAAAVGAMPLRARAAEFTFKLGVALPAEHPGAVEVKAACDRVREATSGRVDIQLFPSNQLGSDTDMLSQVRSGALEMLMLITGVLATYVPVAAIANVGFAFTGYDQVWQAMDGSLGALVRERVGRAGLVALDRMWDNGFRQMTTRSRPVRGVGDVAGLKIRVPVSSIYTSMWSALGASPVAAGGHEMYAGLQTGLFDAQENPLAIIQSFKLYEVEKTCALTSHMWDGLWFLVNRRAWAGLPAALQETVAGVLNEGAVRQRGVMAQSAGTLEGTLTQEGLAFTRPDRTPFRAKLSTAGFYAQWKTQFGEEAWSRLEAVSGALA